jgi:glycosyltransferase involved in cell wall biosynthesis
MSVSVVMVTYLHAPFLEEAINAVLSQELNEHIELIIADDYSPDETFKIVEHFIKTHPKGDCIKYIRRTSNIGMTANFIDALRQCTGKYIAICDGDDYWIDSNKLQKQINFLENNLNHAFCWTRFKKLSNAKVDLAEDSNGRYFSENQEIVEYDFEVLSSGWELGIQTLVFRKECINFDRIIKYKYFRDIHLITELLTKGKGSCLGFFGACYRIHDNGIYTGTENKKKIEIAFNIYREIFKFHSNNDYIKKQLRYYGIKYFENTLKASKIAAKFVAIKLYCALYDYNLLKHQFKTILGL